MCYTCHAYNDGILMYIHIVILFTAGMKDLDTLQTHRDKIDERNSIETVTFHNVLFTIKQKHSVALKLLAIHDINAVDKVLHCTCWHIRQRKEHQ